MNKTLYADGIYVQASDLNNTVAVKQVDLAARITDFSDDQVGVVSGLVLSAREGFVVVSAGISYDSAGERAEVLIETALPILQSDAGKFVSIKATPKESDEVEHPQTGTLEVVRTIVLTEVYLSDGMDGSVILGLISSVDRSGLATFSLIPRQEWSVFLPDGYITDDRLDPNGSILAHVAALGTGIVTATNPHGIQPVDLNFVADTTPQDHQDLDHVDGVEPDGSTAGFVTAGPDHVEVEQIAGDDSIVVGGVRLLADGLDVGLVDIPGDDEETRSGLYEVWVTRPTAVGQIGTLGTTRRATYLNDRTVLGVQIIDVDPLHDTGAAVLALTYSGGVRTIRWNDGPAAQLGAADASYTLIGRTGRTITVWAVAADLPAYSAGDVVEILPSGIGQNHFQLAAVYFGQLADTSVGYGPEGTGGGILDKRIFGTFAYRNAGPSGRDLIERLHRDMRRDGFSSGGDVEVTGPLRISIRAGVTWIDGRRIVFITSSVVLAPSSVTIVMVDSNGHLVTFLDDPDGVHVSEPFRFARVSRVTTDQSKIVALQDDRTVLPLIDNQAKLGAGLRHNSFVQQIARLIVPQGSHGQSTNNRRGRTRLLFSQRLSPDYHDISFYLCNFVYDETDPVTKIQTTKSVVGFEIAINAVWTPDVDPDTHVDGWVAVNTDQDAILYGFEQKGTYVRFKTKETFDDYWTDRGSGSIGTWDDEVFDTDLRDSRLALNVSGAGAAALITSLLTLGASYTNTLTPVNRVAAWAVLDITLGAVRVVTGFNVDKAIVDVAGSPSSVYLMLSGPLVYDGGGIPKGSVVVSNDKGLSNPLATPGAEIYAKLVRVLPSGATAVLLSSTDNLSVGGSGVDDDGVPLSIPTATVYVAVTGAQTSAGGFL